MLPINILVVEDEPLVAQDIAEHLAEIGYQIIGPADSFDDAKREINQSEIHLVLIDIKLKGERDGIDLAHYIRTWQDIPIIFLSSLTDEESVLRAKTTHPSTFLLKPFHAKAVRIAIEMALANHALYKNTKPSVSDIGLEDALPIGKFLFLRKDSSFHRVALADIRWIKADGNYTEFFTTETRFVQTIQLSKVENRLPKNIFRRVHRSYLVNIGHVTSFSGNTLYLDDQQITVSLPHRDEIFQLFNAI